MTRGSQSKGRVLWRLTGMMVVIVAAAGGALLSEAATAVSAKAGMREQSIAFIAVVALLAGFFVTLVAGLRDLAALARRNEPSLPRRWAIGSIAALFVAGPLWSFFVVHVQERISGSDSVRTAFDNVMYGLVLTLTLPLALGVPLMVRHLRKARDRSL